MFRNHCQTRWGGLLAALLCATAGLAQSEEKPATPEVPAEKAVKSAYFLMKTTEGPILLELNVEKAPLTVDNFLRYAQDGFYQGTIFHRVISNFMIQGGGMTVEGQQKPTRPPIRNESGNSLKNVRGAIAMARTQLADSATAQFFINVKDNAMLDQMRRTPDGKMAAYAVFGKVIAGMDTVDKIRDTETKMDDMGREKAVPVTPIVIEDVQLLTEAEAKQMKAAIDEHKELPALAADREAEIKQLTAAIHAAEEHVAMVELQDTIAAAEKDSGQKIQKTASGLMYVMMKEGEGDSPTVQNTVRVAYKGWLLNGTVFDQNDGVSFPLSRLIRAWQEAIPMLKVGGKMRIIVPPAIGYGPAGSPPVIPPNATLVFDIELLGIEG